MKKTQKKKTPKPVPPKFAALQQAHQAKMALMPDVAHDQHDRETAHGPRGPPLAVRLLGKREVLAIVGCSYPTLWKMMRENRFPRSVMFGGRSVWRSDVIDAFLANLSVRPLKGDPAPVELATSAIGGGAQ